MTVIYRKTRLYDLVVKLNLMENHLEDYGCDAFGMNVYNKYIYDIR